MKVLARFCGKCYARWDIDVLNLLDTINPGRKLYGKDKNEGIVEEGNGALVVKEGIESNC